MSFTIRIGFHKRKWLPQKVQHPLKGMVFTKSNRVYQNEWLRLKEMTSTKKEQLPLKGILYIKRNSFQ